MNFSIRPLKRNELHRLAYLPFSQMDTHRRRFEMQETGRLIFLVAWWHDLPVGQTLLNWKGGDASGVPPQVRGGPEISSLFVSPSYRRKGIATLLLDQAEQITFAHRHDRIGLCVAIDNTVARKIYIRRGYRDAGWQPYMACGTFTNKFGKQQTWEEMRIYLEKPLRSRNTQTSPPSAAPTRKNTNPEAPTVPQTRTEIH